MGTTISHISFGSFLSFFLKSTRSSQVQWPVLLECELCVLGHHGALKKMQKPYSKVKKSKIILRKLFFALLNSWCPYIEQQLAQQQHLDQNQPKSWFVLLI